MSTFISILRGINVGGHKKILMQDLKALYEDLGFKNISTYIQSGNVVFNTSKKNVLSISESIEKAILKKYSFEVSVISLDPKDLEAAIKNNPFLKQKNVELEKIYFTFLKEEALPENIEKIKAFKLDGDAFVIDKKAVYLNCGNGYGNTKLSNNFFESKLKVLATTRNYKTVCELIKIAASY